MLVVLLATSSISYSQDVARVYKADSIYFYGYDFSHTIVKTKHPINDYVFPWIIHTSKVNTPSYFEKKMYMSVIHDFSYTNKVNIEFIENLVVRNERKIIEEDETTGRYPLLFDKPNISAKKDEGISAEIPNEVIQKLLFEYLLTQQTGIGLVVFVAEINKEEESTLLHFVFFDIKGRDIISAYKSHLSGAKGIGMEKHWKHNFSMSTTNFLDVYEYWLARAYRSEYKRKRKRMKKLKGK